jgi:hypothetical protein
VEAASQMLADAKSNSEFGFGISWLSDLETKGTLPNVYKIYTLSVIYHVQFSELISWLGLDDRGWMGDLPLVTAPKTHLINVNPSAMPVPIPQMDPAFDRNKTTDIGRMVLGWGLLPVSLVADILDKKYTYAYVGAKDFSMYPLIFPGSFLQIDERRKKIASGPWPSEYERPVYFVETRERFWLGWCAWRSGQLIVQFHPSSNEPARTFATEGQAEVIGQVVGLATRLSWREENDTLKRGSIPLHN